MEDGVSASDEFQNPLFDSGNGKKDGFDGSRADSKRIKLMDLNQKVGVVLNLSQEHIPLGLTLKKTPSFLDLIEMKLSKRIKTNIPVDMDPSTNYEKGIARTNDFVAQPMVEKLKASNIPATLLKIGSWEVVSRYEGDLVAKCYFAKRKLVWEVLEHGLKSKIEVQWSEISAIRASFRENEVGILEIELSNAPLFFRETDPQPRKHTLWQATSDFTGGEAPVYRRHLLQFPVGTLDKHYEKLLQCDDRLFMLSQRPFPTQNSPYFPSNLYKDLCFEFNGCAPQFSPGLHFPHQGISRPTLGHSHQVQNFEPAITPSFGAEDSTSPMSVIDFPPMDENGVSHCNKYQRTSFWGQGINNGNNIPTRNGDHFREQSYYLLTSEERSGKSPSNNYVLDDIADHLLNDPPGEFFDEHRLLSKVNSMSSLLGISNELSLIKNNGTEYREYGHNETAKNAHLISRSTEQSNGDGGLPILQPVNWFQAQGFNFNENSLMYLPRNTSYPNRFVDDITRVNPANEANQWR
ncbi:hypothetical protein HHK36_012273 [Tetracentron sinense]|uniref:TRF2/HOY1 PH-like domain-containing protein n=1 Tax=Tetracentron sinense TaxID=13715 RepID=A0A834Z5I7_TETSI|nr:hypothetical protein HHK36_012273 [Tetracentron sinense]